MSCWELDLGHAGHLSPNLLQELFNEKDVWPLTTTDRAAAKPLPAQIIKPHISGVYRLFQEVFKRRQKVWVPSKTRKVLKSTTEIKYHDCHVVAHTWCSWELITFNDQVVFSWNILSFVVSSNSGKIQKDGRKESCKPILKVEYKTSRNRWVLYNVQIQNLFPDYIIRIRFISFLFHHVVNEQISLETQVAGQGEWNNTL